MLASREECIPNLFTGGERQEEGEIMVEDQLEGEIKLLNSGTSVFNINLDDNKIWDAAYQLLQTSTSIDHFGATGRR